MPSSNSWLHSCHQAPSPHSRCLTVRTSQTPLAHHQHRHSNHCYPHESTWALWLNWNRTNQWHSTSNTMPLSPHPKSRNLCFVFWFSFIFLLFPPPHAIQSAPTHHVWSRFLSYTKQHSASKPSRRSTHEDSGPGQSPALARQRPQRSLPDVAHSILATP